MVLRSKFASSCFAGISLSIMSFAAIAWKHTPNIVSGVCLGHRLGVPSLSVALWIIAKVVMFVVLGLQLSASSPCVDLSLYSCSCS
jgi:hypothetical protein